MLAPVENGPGLIVRFEGGHANEHYLRSRQLGESLIGFERLIAAGLFAVERGRLPRGRERMPFAVYATAPQRGSLEVWLLENAAFLQLFQELYLSGAKDIIWHWINGVMLRFGGRPRGAARHMDSFLDLHKQYISLQEQQMSLQEQNISLQKQVEANRHDEIMAAIDTLANSTRQAVSPIGRSCHRMFFGNGEPGRATEVDAPMADAIRSRSKLKVVDMDTVLVRVDGLTHHNRQLKVAYPEEPNRFLTAVVRDPVFESTPNVYTDAATEQGLLEVRAKATMKDGRIQKLYVMDAKRVQDPGS